MTATACCTSKPIIYQIQVIAARSQFSPILPRTTLVPSSSVASIPEPHPSIRLTKTVRNDVNNNDPRRTITAYQDTFEILNENEVVDSIDEAQFLALVGLRHKTRKKPVPFSITRPLAKRLAAPVCLLPLPKYAERVRQALYILLPFLKFLSITHDAEQFCSADDQAQTESLLPRSVTQTRTPETMYTKTNKRKVSKSEYINMAVNTFRNNTRSTPMAKYINSTIQCQVVLDRLDQVTIDQIMETSTADNPAKTLSISENQQSSPSRDLCSLNQTTTKTITTLTTITTMTTEKTTVKHKSTTTTSFNDAKRFKASIDDTKAAIAYKRIYLKCFVCAKREYIDAQVTNSDVLHSHWLEHGHDLLLNIYDSELDSILTRIVEFFHFPRRHTLEGKIQTVFILNSKEIRRRSSKPVDDDSCIVLD